MKKTLIIILLFAFNLYAEENSVEGLIKCLGREESRIHKDKLGGAVYELNQRLISELIMFSKIQIKAEVFQNICSNTKAFASVKLLEHLIEKQENFFVIPNNLLPVDQEIIRSSINEFLDMIPEIFMLYISQLQAYSARPNCLEDHVKLIKKLNREIKALEQDIPARKIMQKDQIAYKILVKLRNVDEIHKKCDAEKKAKEEAEKKKREKDSKPN